MMIMDYKQSQTKDKQKQPTKKQPTKEQTRKNNQQKQQALSLISPKRMNVDADRNSKEEKAKVLIPENKRTTLTQPTTNHMTEIIEMVMEKVIWK